MSARTIIAEWLMVNVAAVDDRAETQEDADEWADEILSRLVAAGFKIVSREPTEAMVEAIAIDIDPGILPDGDIKEALAKSWDGATEHTR